MYICINTYVQRESEWVCNIELRREGGRLLIFFSIRVVVITVVDGYGIRASIGSS